MTKKKKIIILCIAVILIVATTVTVIVWNATKNQPIEEPIIEEVPDPEYELPDFEPPVFDPNGSDDQTKPHTPTQADEDVIADIDVGQMTRNPEPGLIDSDVEYGTKD